MYALTHEPFPDAFGKPPRQRLLVKTLFILWATPQRFFWNYPCSYILFFFLSPGLDNSICTYGGLLTFKKGKIDSIRSHPAGMYPLRIILINSKVARNTQSLVEKVKTERANLLPLITDCILDAMDQVAKKCLKILDQLSELRYDDFENENNISDGILSSPYVENCYHVLEVSGFKICEFYDAKCHWNGRCQPFPPPFLLK